jgi:uncharacterized protein (DUF1697 family)
MTQRLVALLGSINVGGNRVKMAELRAALEAVGFANVATVTASGNVLFDHRGQPDADVQRIFEELLSDRFGIKSFAAIRTRAELAAAIADNPFAEDGIEKFVHTIFLEVPLDRSRFDRFAEQFAGPERIAAGTREFYVDYATGVARSKLDQAMNKAKIVQSRATARNVRSLKRILEAVGG